MASIKKYAVVADPEEWGDEDLHDSLREALEAAQRESKMVLEIEYEYTGSSPAEDYRRHLETDIGNEGYCGEVLLPSAARTKEPHEVTCEKCQSRMNEEDEVDDTDRE